MMKSLGGAALAAAVFVCMGTPVLAGPIDSACLRSDRGAGQRALCGCIQQVADMTLGRSDQRRAAKFFKDPDLAHATWISQKPSDDAFWDRYKEFGSLAEAYCGG